MSMIFIFLLIYFSDISSQDLPADLANFDCTHFESMFDKSNDMDVEEDVASWLDSLCANSNASSNSKLVAQPRLNELTQPHLNELNGNRHGLSDLSVMMSRGDPLMGSANNMRHDLE